MAKTEGLSGAHTGALAPRGQCKHKSADLSNRDQMDKFRKVWRKFYCQYCTKTLESLVEVGFEGCQSAIFHVLARVLERVFVFGG